MRAPLLCGIAISTGTAPLGRPPSLLRSLLAAAVLALLAAAPASAQSERFLLGPGSNVGPETKIKPTNCVTAPDGSITCDTQIENSPSDTPAKPQYDPFDN